MVAVIVLIVLGLALAVVVFLLVKSWLFSREVLRNFKTCNVIVTGKKGRGKDVLTQWVISKRKKPYYANISYGGAYTHIKLRDISAEPNTYESFIDDKVTICKRWAYEKEDVYISDAGVHLPSQMDGYLHKKYPGLPIYYALSRHLANHNIHCNVQNLGRLWKALREQADYYVNLRGVLRLPFFLALKMTTYDKYESAYKLLEPVKPRLINKYSRAETDIYKASNGEIKTGWVIIPKRILKYDTRAFEKVLYGQQKRLERKKHIA